MTDNSISIPGVADSTPVAPLSGSVHDLYSVYLEVARIDHQCRRAALYGVQSPPPGHTPFRPLSFQDFETRFNTATSVPQGEDIFRRQLARQADVYGVAVSNKPTRRAA
jgi:hypothetical protein